MAPAIVMLGQTGHLVRRDRKNFRGHPGGVVSVSEVTSGLEVLVGEQTALLRGQRVGIVTNEGAIDRRFQHVVDVIQALPGVEVVRLFAAEHGIRGADAAGVPVADGIDPISGIPVQSIYGPRLWPTDEALEDLDCLLYDIPDVGARFYTRPATLVYCLRAAARHAKRFIVLDRPNPIGGEAIEGPSLRPGFESFVGLAGLPIRHGLTLGELARFVNFEEGLNADLVVVPARGWRRATWYDQTDLPWILPSPNLPTLDSATVYPGTCFVEGTTASEGRGTTRPFELLGAPFVDAHRLATALNQQHLPGVHFRPAFFRPVNHKHANTMCGGVQVHVTDRDIFRPVFAGVAILLTIRRLWPDDFAWRPAPVGTLPFIDRLAGGTWLREAVAAQADPRDVAAEWRRDEADFAERRRPHLLSE